VAKTAVAAMGHILANSLQLDRYVPVTAWASLFVPVLPPRSLSFSFLCFFSIFLSFFLSFLFFSFFFLT
jgi:hypothetical protein